MDKEESAKQQLTFFLKNDVICGYSLQFGLILCYSLLIIASIVIELQGALNKQYTVLIFFSATFIACCMGFASLFIGQMLYFQLTRYAFIIETVIFVLGIIYKFWFDQFQINDGKALFRGLRIAGCVLFILKGSVIRMYIFKANAYIIDAMTKIYENKHAELDLQTPTTVNVV